MLLDNKILIGKGENQVFLLPNMANRHGLIAGATGTGKTVTLKVLAESFSDMGVPVFLADIKGDVSGTAVAGTDSEKLRERLNNVGVDPATFRYNGYPCRFWDVFGKGGIPVRATITDLGPLLLSRLLNLTEVQEGVLNIAFRIADDNGWELIDLKDLRSMLTFLGENRQEFVHTYGNISSQSIGAIQRSLLALENEGATDFFGEPDLDINDWMQLTPDGKGMVNILHCVELAQRPLLYATFMLWMLSELFENLPEVGDPEKPKLVFFFDEAHMLFSDAPKALVDKVVQVVKLIRSKGVGIFFITQSPSDIPDDVLAQLNNRIQHALRAYTPSEQKAVRVAAQSFRANPAFKTEDAISEIGTGVALVSTLDEKGVPSMVEKTTICPPSSSMDACDPQAKAMMVTGDALYGKYSQAIDDRSAYEIIEEVAAEQAQLEAEEAERNAKKKRGTIGNSLMKATRNTAKTIGRNTAKTITRGILGNTNKTVTNAAGQFLGNIVSDVIGSILK